jgi:phosphate:Na+ symporter
LAILSFLISLAGATMLLLFAVRMVRTGIERRFGASFRRLLTQNDSMFSASMAGLALAVVLQRSAAVALLTSGFSASGMLAFPAGLAIVLGADLGSALIIQVLSFKLDWLVPLLLASGGWLFVKTERKSWRQAGRILMGIALILISLRFLREAMHPIRDSAFLPAIAEYLARDFITAFIAGAALAFVMHSSVAAILMCVTLVQIGAIPVTAGLSLLLGANLGSAFIPLWLTRDMSPQARRVPLANLALRGSWAIIVLLAINLLSLGHLLDIAGPGQSLIYAHILFNLYRGYCKTRTLRCEMMRKLSVT